MKEVKIKDEFIKLGQALKKAGLVEACRHGWIRCGSKDRDHRRTG